MKFHVIRSMQKRVFIGMGAYKTQKCPLLSTTEKRAILSLFEISSESLQWTCPTVSSSRIPSESTSRIALFLLSTWPSPSSGSSAPAPGLLTPTRIVTFRFEYFHSSSLLFVHLWFCGTACLKQLSEVWNSFRFRADLVDFDESFSCLLILEVNTVNVQFLHRWSLLWPFRFD